MLAQPDVKSEKGREKLQGDGGEKKFTDLESQGIWTYLLYEIGTIMLIQIHTHTLSPLDQGFPGMSKFECLSLVGSDYSFSLVQIFICP